MIGLVDAVNCNLDFRMLTLSGVRWLGYAGCLNSVSAQMIFSGEAAYENAQRH
jgi:hypothetical protein